MAGIIGQKKLEGGEIVRMKKKQIQVGQDQTAFDVIFNFIKQLFLRCTNVFSGASSNQLQSFISDR